MEFYRGTFSVSFLQLNGISLWNIYFIKLLGSFVFGLSSCKPRLWLFWFHIWANIFLRCKAGWRMLRQRIDLQFWKLPPNLPTEYFAVLAIMYAVSIVDHILSYDDWRIMSPWGLHFTFAFMRKDVKYFNVDWFFFCVLMFICVWRCWV